MKIYKVLPLTLLLLGGCSALKIERPNDAAFAPIPPEKMRAPRARNGAIYQNGYAMNLFETMRARRVGDILTIVLVEKTDASKKATTTGIKENTVDVTNPTWFGKPLALANGRNLSFNLESSRNFNGEGESKQNNKLDGSVTVTVADVQPNGNLVVRGEKWITLNQGREYIRLSGVVRPADITPDNTVRSDRVANARISYSGTGQVADTNSNGWLARFFWSSFFPF